jgi:hypothetical protein
MQCRMGQVEAIAVIMGNKKEEGRGQKGGKGDQHFFKTFSQLVLGSRVPDRSAALSARLSRLAGRHGYKIEPSS